jgi:hypothetical protein
MELQFRLERHTMARKTTVVLAFDTCLAKGKLCILAQARTRRSTEALERKGLLFESSQMVA